MSIIKNIALIFLTCAVLSGCATRGNKGNQKVALVIGNSAYQHTAPLPNPANDAAGMAQDLRGLGFDVVEGLDTDTQKLKQVLATFAARLEGARVGLFFYAGHAIQVSGKNLLVPVDASFDESLVANSSRFESQLVSLDRVLEIMDSQQSTNLVFLDACRDNPLVASLSGKGAKGASRSVSQYNSRGIKVRVAQLRKGLAQIEARNSRNMLIAYATQPGNVALDGAGANSPFTSALLENIRNPGVEVRSLLTDVRRSVMAETDDKQIPWDHASLTEPFYFKPLIKTKSVAPPP